MSPPIKTHCLRGHPFTAANIMHVKLKSGYIVRRCRRCRAEKDKARYHSDVAYQAKVRARSLERYRREYDPKVAPCDDAEFGMKP